ncbi:MAG TPA: DinB family protein [Gemmatimonadaceae bacterium]|nr:DinB family protein [Gemmatimonadaceae bacterium]
MSIAQAFLPEFDQEMTTTRALLERVPVTQNSWKPHEKSMTLGRLSAHVATIAHFGPHIVDAEEFDLMSDDAETLRMADFDSTQALLKVFDETTANARRAIAGASDDALRQPWALRRGDRTIMSVPRSAALRTLLLNHLIHHRGQLSVYLRLNDVPLPGIYGPSADTPI